MQNKNNNEILGFLYYDESGRLCVMNETGTYVVLIEAEDSPHILTARSLVMTESQDILWHSGGSSETWDTGILDDLMYDLREEGKNPEDEFSYENPKYSTIIISG